MTYPSTLEAPEVKENLQQAETFWETLKSKLTRSNIPALDGMRAIAVGMVILFHFGYGRVPAGLGVLAFFVLSGFLITWLLLKEHEKTGDISLPSFYLRRTLRIFPAFYAFWFGTIALLYVTHRAIPWNHAIASFFYIGNYYNAILRPPDSFVSHTWSLAIEEQFYLMWPMLFFVFQRDMKKLTTILVALIGCVWLYRIVLSVGLHVSQSYIYNAFETRIDHLLVGCLLAIVMKRGLLTSFWQFLCSRVYMPGVTLALLGVSINLNWIYDTVYRDRIGFAIDPLLIAVLMVQLVWFSSSMAWKWLNWGWIRYVGRMSYSLYLYQQIAHHPIERLLAGKPFSVQFGASVIVVLVMAMCSYHLIEMPFLKLKGKLEARVSRIPAKLSFERT
jgi:peptidoglycan/LPS O-acetylase OafA/YrhL